ncbi:MAG: nickel pincer cofactor biosynthesis protein LarB [Clostridiales Family XIII bacterium]|jgi:NCAIR mutase (PurE)-related protein|nr:nickel pincer cofactor biosynthesis protein LarB [Clostridiales Family XIII bacterium]
MDEKILQKLLREVADGALTPADAVERLKTLPLGYDDMGFAKVDTHRELRTGRAEVIFGIGKTPAQVAAIMARLAGGGAPLVIATKTGPEAFAEAKKAVPEGLRYHEVAKLLVYQAGDAAAPTGKPVSVVCGGTADIPVAEEAALTAELYGCAVQRHYDVGVAGIHRLMDKVASIREAGAVIAVAGMEGALASVVGGLVAVPVIAVPTSIGYGSSMGGLAALLAMLNSCSLGVSVVNIDNGFGAGYLASLIAGKGIHK